MSRPFFIKRDDLVPAITGYVEDDRGAVNLTQASAVTFSMRASGASAALISGAVASIVNATQGLIAYPWASGQTATVGYFEGEFKLTWPQGPQRVPNPGFQPITVGRRI